MRGEWEKYLLGKIELHSLSKRGKKKPKEPKPKGFGLVDGGVVTTKVSNESTEPTAISILENKALLAAASEISKSTTRREEMEVEPAESSKPKKGRGKGKSKKNLVSDSKPQSSVVQIEEPEGKNHNFSTGGLASSSVQTEEAQGESRKSTAGSSADVKPLPPIQFYALDSDQHILEKWKPAVVIVYHPDMTFVREIEIYKAENPKRKLKTYFLFYEDSTEAQKFEASIHRENRAFESLIRQKSLMMIPVDQVLFDLFSCFSYPFCQYCYVGSPNNISSSISSILVVLFLCFSQNGRCVGPATQSTEPASGLLNSVTRKAGGRKPLEKEMQVICSICTFFLLICSFVVWLHSCG